MERFFQKSSGISSICFDAKNVPNSAIQGSSIPRKPIVFLILFNQTNALNIIIDLVWNYRIVSILLTSVSTNSVSGFFTITLIRAFTSASSVTFTADSLPLYSFS